ncbi:DNA recombination protein RmuC [Desulfofustis glycolicus]|uniref:DNA recombination protein RmuC n=1 Tax=Desulfofustis glycolicus DSM 9705 TaxID=1121409 RepID=A0A1M5WDB9_9BACT|nr:DNA recombination protein RmuC [Desulfofustis glycolicus]MCB2217070.1 DNA recombination protein RmuC [Desulfobulbaceae bacterium]SHH85505.1 DNA recombination protein RmuC [Desulfofustis glycolicus DSM 9705]
MTTWQRLLTLAESASPAATLSLAAAGLVLLLLLTIASWRLLYWKSRSQALAGRAAALEERSTLERAHAEEKITLLQQAGDDLRLQFKSLAQEIFDEKTSSFSRLSSERLEGLLQPFREQLHAFKGTVEHAFLEETREHAALKQEIVHLRELNRRINDEAANLARAISGDRKLQGTWGELVLEKLLEQSGLRRGHEYETQVGLRDGDNRLFRPDVIVRLPEQRDIVIDSKVSLSAWTRYIETDDETQRSRALAEHVEALRQHLKSLAGKDYRSLKGLRTLDFVLMFVPIDAAFISAIQAEEDLVGEMYSKNVIIVTPTTLLATLRTIEHFWQLERQNRNALEIAHRAGMLYEKLVAFLEDMERLGRQIDTCKDTYDKALTKISQGRGNLIDQAARFPKLGVKIRSDLPRTMTDKADA